jgi:hypothetical protein
MFECFNQNKVTVAIVCADKVRPHDRICRQRRGGGRVGGRVVHFVLSCYFVDAEIRGRRARKICSQADREPLGWRMFTFHYSPDHPDSGGGGGGCCFFFCRVRLLEQEAWEACGLRRAPMDGHRPHPTPHTPSVGEKGFRRSASPLPTVHPLIFFFHRGQMNGRTPQRSDISPRQPRLPVQLDLASSAVQTFA